MNFTAVEQQTRHVFDAIQAGHLQDQGALDRHRSLLSYRNLGLPEGWLEGKVCADMGCGAAASGMFNLLELGAAHVVGLDLTESFVPHARATLAARPDFDGRYAFDVGSLEDLPYADGRFDFILCHGVLHNVENDRQALAEMFRCLKPGGICHLTVMGQGGLLGRLGMEVMRQEYRANPWFKGFVDTMDVAGLRRHLDWLQGRVEADGSEAHLLSVEFLEILKKLIDEDLLLTISDRLKTPVYHTYSLADFEAMLRGAGFSSWRRTSRQPSYANIRRVVAPLYKDYDHPLARLLYGDGTLVMLATR